MYLKDSIRFFFLFIIMVDSVHPMDLGSELFQKEVISAISFIGFGMVMGTSYGIVHNELRKFSQFFANSKPDIHVFKSALIGAALTIPPLLTARMGSSLPQLDLSELSNFRKYFLLINPFFVFGLANQWHSLLKHWSDTGYKNRFVEHKTPGMDDKKLAKIDKKILSRVINDSDYYVLGSLIHASLGLSIYAYYLRSELV